MKKKGGAFECRLSFLENQLKKPPFNHHGNDRRGKSRHKDNLNVKKIRCTPFFLKEVSKKEGSDSKGDNEYADFEQVGDYQFHVVSSLPGSLLHLLKFSGPPH